MRRAVAGAALVLVLLIPSWLAVTHRYSYQEAKILGFPDAPVLVRIDRLTSHVDVLSHDRGWIRIPVLPQPPPGFPTRSDADPLTRGPPPRKLRGVCCGRIPMQAPWILAVLIVPACSTPGGERTPRPGSGDEPR